MRHEEVSTCRRLVCWYWHHVSPVTQQRLRYRLTLLGGVASILKQNIGVTINVYTCSWKMTPAWKLLTPFSLEDTLHTGYPEPTNATDKRSWNQQAGIGCKYLSGNNLPRFSLIRGKLFPDRYLLLITAYWFSVALLFFVALVVSSHRCTIPLWFPPFPCKGNNIYDFLFAWSLDNEALLIRVHSKRDFIPREFRSKFFR